MSASAETELFDTHHRTYCEAATSVHNMMDRLGSEKYAREQDSLVEQIEGKLKARNHVVAGSELSEVQY